MQQCPFVLRCLCMHSSAWKSSTRHPRDYSVALLPSDPPAELPEANERSSQVRHHLKPCCMLQRRLTMLDFDLRLRSLWTAQAG